MIGAMAWTIRPAWWLNNKEWCRVCYLFCLAPYFFILVWLRCFIFTALARTLTDVFGGLICCSQPCLEWLSTLVIWRDSSAPVFRRASTSSSGHSRVVVSLKKAATILELFPHNISKRFKFISIVTIVRGAKTSVTKRTKSFLLSGQWVRRSGAGCIWIHRLMRCSL